MEPKSKKTSPEDIPAELHDRERIWSEALSRIAGTSRRSVLAEPQLRQRAEAILSALSLDVRYLPYAMVMVNNAFWLEQYLAVPHSQRLLLLPRCLARLAQVEQAATRLGYRLHVAEGSPDALKSIAEGQMHAVLGIGCLESLKSAFQKVCFLGMPALAIPLTMNGCKATEVDMKFVHWLIESEGGETAERTRSYYPLLRTAYGLFDDTEFAALIGEPDSATEDPTRRIALDWLRKGGKKLRPFLTLTGYRVFEPDGDIPTSVKRVALAIEAFHKASLVHDDIEDDDASRYGEITLHRKHGIAIAINVGDYLIGLGYRLIACAREPGDGACIASLARIFSETHLRLAQGQGWELDWRRSRSEDLTLGQVLANYKLKTAAAFEASLASALVLAGVHERHRETVRAFATHLGVAFQIQNDMKSLSADAASVCPTVVLALALERASEAEKKTLLLPGEADAIQEIYERHDAVARALELAARLRQRAEQVATEAPEPLNELLRFLVETILDREDPPSITFRSESEKSFDAPQAKQFVLK